MRNHSEFRLILRGALGFATTMPGLCHAQGQGSWGGGTGIFALVFGVIGLGLLLLGFVGYLIAGALGLPRVLRVLIAVVLACAPPVYYIRQSSQYGAGIDELTEISRQLGQNAEEHLVTQCALQPELPAPIVVRGSEGIYLKSNGNLPPDIRDIPPTPPQTDRSREQQRRYGYSSPPLSNDGQYKAVLNWVTRAEEMDFLEAGFAFVEYQRSNKEPLTRVAPLAWWQRNGSSEALERLLRPYGEVGKNLQPETLMRGPVDKLLASYSIEYRDISTREDREKWLAKGRIQLSKRADDSVLVEYVGLAAAKTFLGPGNGFWWERVSVCPGAETEFLASGRWQPTKFFFSRIARVEG